MVSGRAARQGAHAALHVQGIVVRHLQLLGRVVHQHGMRERAGFHRRLGRQFAQLGAQARQRVVGLKPAAGFALQERELGARRQVAAAHAELHRRAHTFGGLGAQAQVLERHAETEVRDGIVELQRQRVEEGLDRLVVALAALQRDRQRHMVGVVARHVGGQRTQALDRLGGAAQPDQRVRFNGVRQRGARLQLAQAARALHRFGGAAGLDQRVGSRQGIGIVVPEGGGLLEGGGGHRPVVEAGMFLAGLPTLMGAGVGAGVGTRCGW